MSPRHPRERWRVAAAAVALSSCLCGPAGPGSVALRADWNYARQAAFALGLDRDTADRLVLEHMPSIGRQAVGYVDRTREPAAALVRRQLDTAEALADAAAAARSLPPGATAAVGGCLDGDLACVRGVAASVARALWSIEPTDAEIESLAALARAGIADGDAFDLAARETIVAVLASPRAFVVSLPGGSGRPLTAARLSWRLWSRPPDTALLARVGDADTAGPGLTALLGEMLADPRAVSFAEDLAEMMLLTGGSLAAHVDGGDDARFSLTARRAMREEPVRLLQEFLADDLPARHLLDADHTFVDRSLAALYDVPGPDTEGAWLRASLTDARRRGLGQGAGFLSASAKWNRTVIPRRAAFVLARLLCEPPPIPPALPTNTNIPTTETKLEWMALHRSRPDCQSCHEQLDPYGFALEEFGVTGVFRTLDEFGTPPEPAGTIRGGAYTNGVEFAAALANDDRALPCITNHVASVSGPYGWVDPDPVTDRDIGLRSLVQRTYATQELEFANGGPR